MQLFVVSAYDAGAENDVYTAVYGTIVILFFYSSLLKVLMPVFMPMFRRLIDEDGEEKAWQFANTIITLLGFFVITVAIVAFTFAPKIVTTLLPKFSGETQALAVQLLRWMSPGLVVTLFAAMAQGILNSYKVFSYPSAGEAAHKITWATVLFIAISIPRFKGSEFAAQCMGISFLAGCLVQAGILFAGVSKHATFFRLGLLVLSKTRLMRELGILALAVAACAGCVPLLHKTGIDENNLKFALITTFIFIGCIWSLLFWHRARKSTDVMARCAALMAPLLIGILFARYRDLTSAFFQSYSPKGAFGIIEIAKKVVNLPTVLVAYSLSIAMFPYLCDLASRKDTKGLAEIVARTLRMIALFFIPLTVLTVIMAEPVMQLLVDRVGWSDELIRTGGIALAFVSLGLFFMSIENILMTTFFSLQRMVLPTVLGIFFSVTYSIGLWFVITKLGYSEPEQAFLVVCIAYPLPKILKNLTLMFFLHRRIGLFKIGETSAFIAKLIIISAAVAGSSWMTFQGVSRALPLAPMVEMGRLKFELLKCIHVAVPSLAAALVFFTLIFILKLEEPRIIIQWVRDKGWKKKR